MCIYEDMTNFFWEDEWPIIELADEQILITAFHGENGQWNCSAVAREEQKQFLFYSVPLLTVPEEKRQSVAEFLTRANYGLSLGTFEMDFADGEVRFRTSACATDGHLDHSSIQQAVYANLVTTDYYWLGLMAVIYGDVDPSIAIEQIEKREEVPA